MATPQQSTTKYLKIKVGETGVLKSNVKILSIVVDGNAQADSDCINLPAPETLSCYTLKWAIEYNADANTGPWSFGDTNAHIVEIGVADVNYTVTFPIDGGFHSTDTDSDLQVYITNNIPSGAITPVKVTRNTIGERGEIVLTFKATTSIGPNVFLKFTAPGLDATVGALIYAEACADCCGGGS